MTARTYRALARLIEQIKQEAASGNRLSLLRPLAELDQISSTFTTSSFTFSVKPFLSDDQGIVMTIQDRHGRFRQMVRVRPSLSEDFVVDTIASEPDADVRHAIELLTLLLGEYTTISPLFQEASPALASTGARSACS